MQRALRVPQDTQLPAKASSSCRSRPGRVRGRAAGSSFSSTRVPGSSPASTTTACSRGPPAPEAHKTTSDSKAYSTTTKTYSTTPTEAHAPSATTSNKASTTKTNRAPKAKTHETKADWAKTPEKGRTT